jgi:hypothetical protein
VQFQTYHPPEDSHFKIAHSAPGKFAVDSQQSLYIVAPKARIRGDIKGCSIVRISKGSKAQVAWSSDDCPWGLAADARGEIFAWYMFDSGLSVTETRSGVRHHDKVYKIELDGTARVVAELDLSEPLTGFSVQSTGEIYWSEKTAVWVRSPDGVARLLAGSEKERGFVDGAATAARFNNINDLAVDHSGTIYISDGGNIAVREITPNGVVTTLFSASGRGAWAYDPKAVGPLRSVQGVAVLPTGDLMTINNASLLVTH